PDLHSFPTRRSSDLEGLHLDVAEDRGVAAQRPHLLVGAHRLHAGVRLGAGTPGGPQPRDPGLPLGPHPHPALPRLLLVGRSLTPRPAPLASLHLRPAPTDS